MSTIALESSALFSGTSTEVHLLGLPAERAAKRQLSGDADEVIKTINAMLQGLVLQVIDKKEKDEFQAARREAFPKYVELVLAAGKILGTITTPSVMSRLASESFCELESDFRGEGSRFFGPAIEERALFTVWTLRKISGLLDELHAAGNVQCDASKDAEFHRKFLVYALWARFSVDCLVASMRAKRPIYPEAMSAVSDGLRATVDAYAWIRQAVDLRQAADGGTEFATPAWTTEDQELVNESMSDIALDED
jgi:hypothetical protein